MKNIITPERTKWAIDQSHSQIEFRIRHLMIAHVNGVFRKFDASIYLTDKNFTTAEIDIWIDVSSLSTGDSARDEHLKGADFFDADKYKQISFTSSTIGKSDLEDNHVLWGELTMRGITQNIKLNVIFGGLAIDPMGNEKAGFTVTGTINRNDWGLNWNSALETGGLLVGEEVQIICEIELMNLGQQDLTMTLEPETLSERHPK